MSRSRGGAKAYVLRQLTDHDSSVVGRRAGQSADIEIQAKEILGPKKRLNEMLAEQTGQELVELRPTLSVTSLCLLRTRRPMA